MSDGQAEAEWSGWEGAWVICVCLLAEEMEEVQEMTCNALLGCCLLRPLNHTGAKEVAHHRKALALQA